MLLVFIIFHVFVYFLCMLIGLLLVICLYNNNLLDNNTRYKTGSMQHDTT